MWCTFGHATHLFGRLELIARLLRESSVGCGGSVNRRGRGGEDGSRRYAPGPIGHPSSPRGQGGQRGNRDSGCGGKGQDRQEQFFYKLPALVKLTNTEPFAAWFAITRDGKRGHTCLAASNSSRASFFAARRASACHTGVPRA
jgi:hypothetical protein